MKPSVKPSKGCTDTQTFTGCYKRLKNTLSRVGQFYIQTWVSFARQLTVGIEIDPRSMNADGSHELANIGFNRFSIGVQDFSNEVQLAINRVQSGPFRSLCG